MCPLGRTIPALPVRDVTAAVAYYRERFGFDSPHETDDYAVVDVDALFRELEGTGLDGNLLTFFHWEAE